MSIGPSSRLEIRTPEGILFSLSLAGPVARFLSWIVDAAAMSSVLLIAGMILRVLDLFGGAFSDAARVLAFFIVQIGYGIALEWFWRGQTLGKRLLGLRVMDAQGLRLQFSQVVVRNLLRFVDMLPVFYLVGGVACLINRRAQRLGDLAANTIVVRQPRVLEPNLDQLLAGKYNSLRDHRHLVARLHQRISPEEARIGLEAILRREELDAEARVRLYAEIAAHYRAAVEFPPETVEGITDEQYVRNVLDALFRHA